MSEESVEKNINKWFTDLVAAKKESSAEETESTTEKENPHSSGN